MKTMDGTRALGVGKRKTEAKITNISLFMPDCI